MCLILGAKPDINFSVNYFSRFVNVSIDIHWPSTMNFYILVEPPDLSIAKFCWSRLGKWPTGLNPTTGYLFMAQGCAILWAKENSQRLICLQQKLSSEALWLQILLNEMKIKVNYPKIIFEGHQVCIQITKNPVKHKRINYFISSEKKSWS